MKTFRLLLLSILHLTFISEGYSQIQSSANWDNYTSLDGLISDNIDEVLIEDNSNVWIATNLGLSHFDGSIFTNYTTANSNLNSNVIKELKICQNKLWLVSDSGLSSFDGTTFTNYTTSNGLLNVNIEGIASTSTDTLWIATQNGISKFDGTNFYNYPNLAGRDIETDSLDRVYVMWSSTASGNFPFVYLYSSGVWTMPTPMGITFGVSRAKLVKTASNSLFITGHAGNPTAFLKINYPLNCEEQKVYYQNSPYNTNSVSEQIYPEQFEEHNGLRWMGGRSYIGFYYVSSDSNYVGQYVKSSTAISNCIKAKGNLLVIGSDQGLYITKPTQKSNNNGLELAINSIKTSVNQTSPLFTNAINSYPNFEIPKGSDKHGIFMANFIVAAKKSSQNNFTVSANSFPHSFTPGPRSTSAGTSNNYMVSVLKQDIINHIANYNQIAYTMPIGIKDWPASGDSALGIAQDLAPFFDSNNNGCYDPQNGDYPVIKGDQTIYWINHPIDQNLELEYHWMMYAFNEPTNKSLDQTLFVQYTMINRSAVTYDSVKVGFFIDGDIGNSYDDYAGTDSLNNIIYFYNGDA